MNPGPTTDLFIQDPDLRTTQITYQDLITLRAEFQSYELIAYIWRTEQEHLRYQELRNVRGFVFM